LINENLPTNLTRTPQTPVPHFCIDALGADAYDSAFGKQKMSKTKTSRIQLDIERCKGCGLCVLYCPKGSLRMTQELNNQGNPYVEQIDPAACNACGICFRMCPDVAIKISDNKGSKSDSIDEPSIHGKANGHG
jgi:2-oxoglutarate ferredoxin oxidoreductase subunit delta